MSNTNKKPTVKQVLETLGLGEYYCRFEEEEFDYGAFLEVTDEQLRELNLKMGPRTKILTEIHRIKREQKSSKKIYITMRGEISQYSYTTLPRDKCIIVTPKFIKSIHKILTF